MSQWFKDLWSEIKNFFIGNWNRVLVFFLVLIIGIVVIKVVVRLLRRSFRKSRLDNAAGSFLASLINAVLYIIYLIALLSLLGIPTTSIVALFSAFALAISLALQNTISNIASGIVIILTKPFTEGDYIEQGGFAGTVQDITIFNTHLLTPDNKTVVLPNKTVVDAGLTNYSTQKTRRLDLTLSVAYGTDVEFVKKVALGVIAKHENVLQDPAPMVRLAEHGSSSLDFTCRVWINGTDYWDMFFALKEEILAAFNENGISVPFNQVDVHVIK